jgi:HD-like signal output (HDOD) protein
MTVQSFDHERLDVYRLSIDYVARSFEAAQRLEGLHRHARGSALKCAAIQDVLVTTKGIKVQDDAVMKAMLHRIVAMLTRMAMKFDGVAESSAEYDVENAGIDYDNEHSVAEHEHETQNQRYARTKPST